LRCWNHQFRTNITTNKPLSLFAISTTHQWHITLGDWSWNRSSGIKTRRGRSCRLQN
jgi:hypothetical protein